MSDSGEFEGFFSAGLPQAAKDEWMTEVARAQAELMRFLQAWPEQRKHVAYALLGSAVATVDLMGGDAEAFLAGLRKRYPKPSPLKPPEKR